MRSVRRKQVTQNRKSRNLVLITFSVLFFLYLTVSLILGDRGVLKYIQLKSIRTQYMAEATALERQNKDMKGQVESFKKTPDIVEELAREFGMTKEGELIYKFKDAP
jgi:cell division protein FtsB